MRHWLGIAAAVTAFLLFAGQFVVAKYGSAIGLAAYDMVALRFAVAAILALPFLWHWGMRDLAGISWRRGAILAAIAGPPYLLLVFSGLTFSNAGNAVLINPGATLIGGLALSILWLREGNIAARILAGAIVIIGLLLVGLGSPGTTTSERLIGDTLLGISGLLWAVFIALLHRWAVNPLRATLAVSFLSALYLPFYWLLAGDNLDAIPMQEILLQAGYQGLAHGVLAIAFFAYAIRVLGAGWVSIMTPIVPITGMALAASFLGESLSTPQILGGGLVCLGMLAAGYLSARRSS